jgi:hypothetical protein
VLQLTGLFDVQSTLDAIALTVQASNGKLTETQRYIFQQVASIFGRDAFENLFLMATFADPGEPQVTHAVDADHISPREVLKFNNSVLFCPARAGGFDSWEMGMENYQAWLQLLYTLEPRSLEQTRLVLRTRQTLMTDIQEMHRLIRAGFVKLNNKEQVKRALEQHKTDIDANRKFTMTVLVQKADQIPTEPGQYVTNCVVCGRTCHEHCVYAKKEDKHKCSAMDRHGYCRMCTTRKCSWRDHQNDRFYYRFTTVTKEGTSQEALAKYQKANREKISAEAVIATLQREFNDIRIELKQHVESARLKVKQLFEISARPNPFSPVE